MELENYILWREVITEDELHALLNELTVKKDIFSVQVLLEILEELSERIQKFYGTFDLKNEEKDIVMSVLCDLTDFSNLSTMESLIFVMFGFELDEYCEYLEIKIDFIQDSNVKKEVTRSIKEYREQ